MKLWLIKVFIILCLVSVSVVEADEQFKSAMTVQENSSPEKTLGKFAKLMYSGVSRDSNTKDLAQAIELIEPENINGKVERKSSILQKAKNLLFLLQSINYSPDDVVVISNDDNKAVIELKDDSHHFFLDFVKKKGKGWIFASSNFKTESYTEAIKVINTIKKNIAEYADTFVPELSSPLNTLYTFLYGVQNIHGYDLADAVKTLNLSNLDPKVAESLGPTWAVQAYRMLLFSSTIKPETLPNDPMYDGNIVLLLDKDYGMINMELVTDKKTEKKAWKIEYNGTTNFNKVYDSYMNQGMQDLIKNSHIPDLPLHIRLDDFFQLNLPFLEAKIFGINLWKYLLIVLLILSTYIIRPVVRFFSFPVINFVMSLFKVTSSHDANQRFIFPLQISVIAYVWLWGVVVITANSKIMSATIIALNIILCFTVTLILYRVIDSSCSVASNKFNTSLHILTDVLGRLLKIVVLIVAGLYICSVLNINTTNFLAALGIGGFAFALAGKDTIENFFGSIMIIVDRPFRTGDYIVIDGIHGCIDEVGVRSTKIRTFEDSVITIPNRKFISSPVENFEVRKWRRYKTYFSILYQTDMDKITLFTKGLTELIRLHPDSNNDRTQVYFYSLDDFSLQIYVNIFFRNRGRVEELKAREEINIQAIRLAEKLGIEFAYPTQTLFLNKQENEGFSGEIAEIGDKNEAVNLARKISPYYCEKDNKQ